MAQDKPKPSPREHYELRVYTVDSATQQQRIANYWAEAAIPALNRQGIKNIGLFQETKPQEGEQFGQVIVLVPYKTIGQFASSVSKLNADKEYKRWAPTTSTRRRMIPPTVGLRATCSGR